MGVDLSPLLDKGDTNEASDVAHIINQYLSGNSIADAAVFGQEVVALCGYRYIPTRDPYKLPVCKACKVALEATT